MNGKKEPAKEITKTKGKNSFPFLEKKLQKS